MSYYFTKILNDSFDEAVAKVTDGLKEGGFGILSEIDVKKRLKKKYDVDFRRYVILGVCIPPFESKPSPARRKIGDTLPCDVVVQEVSSGRIKVTAIDPLASVYAAENPKMQKLATEICGRLKTVVERI